MNRETVIADEPLAVKLRRSAQTMMADDDPQEQLEADELFASALRQLKLADERSAAAGSSGTVSSAF